MDTARLHDLISAVEDEYRRVFAGRVANELERFDAFLATVRMIVDQSADMADKE